MISKEEFETVCLECSPGLFRMAYSILRSTADVQDAMQQAILKAWEKRENVDPKRFKGYLIRILINECYNIQRIRRRTFPVETFPEGEAAETPDTGLHDALNAMPENLRTPLLLRYMEDYSEREIAQALCLSLPTVKSRLHRGRKQLRVMLSREANE